MSATWSHLCNASNSFSTLLLTQDCKVCGTDYRVQTLRHFGYQPSSLIKSKSVEEPSMRKKLAALFQPKPTRYEHEDDYNDRQG
jgi:hypothetical protein